MKLVGTNLAGGVGSRKRVDNDFYATPPDAVKAILDKEVLTGTVLEPACGQGHISKELEAVGLNVTSTDLIDRGYGKGNIDFLQHRFDHKYDNVITNPPFKYAQEFIEKALQVANKKVLMFAKIQLLEGVSRQKLFTHTPPKYVYVFIKRVSPYRNGNEVDEKGRPWSSTMCFAWFVWYIGKTSEPIIRWL